MRSGLCLSLLFTGLGLGVLLNGCGQPAGKSSGKTPSPSSISPQKPAGPKQADVGTAPARQGLAGLSEADRALAEKQRVCLVTGEPLGSMGTPVKVTVKGQTVFLCCEGCEPALKANPDEYLAKLTGAGQE